MYSSKNELTIGLPIKEVINEFVNNVQTSGYLRYFKNDKSKKFYSSGNNTKLKIVLKTSYRNSFKPVINVEFIEISPEKTKMIIKYSLHTFVQVILLFIL